MFAEDNSIPRGSPLGPFGAARTPKGLPVPPPYISRASFSADEGYEDGPAPQAFERPGALQLPKMPPSAKRRATPWDKEHISETLLGIGAGFLSSQNFGDGLGNAAQAIGGRMKDIRTERRRSTKYGGPGDQFQIVTDADGNDTITEVPAFRDAVARETAGKVALAQASAASKQGMSDKEKMDFRSRALHVIQTQVPPEKRQEAYQRLIGNPEQYGIDPTGMPTQWDDLYGTIGGGIGMSVNQSLTQDRGQASLDERKRHAGVMEGQGAQRVQQGAARVAQGAARVAQGAARLAKGGGAKKPSGYVRVSTREQFNALPSGSKIIAPDGSLRVKP